MCDWWPLLKEFVSLSIVGPKTKIQENLRFCLNEKESSNATKLSTILVCSSNRNHFLWLNNCLKKSPISPKWLSWFQYDLIIDSFWFCCFTLPNNSIWISEFANKTKILSNIFLSSSIWFRCLFTLLLFIQSKNYQWMFPLFICIWNLCHFSFLFETVFSLHEQCEIEATEKQWKQSIAFCNRYHWFLFIVSRHFLYWIETHRMIVMFLNEF